MQLFVNDLTVIDFSYVCKQRGIVGESWIVDVLLEGDLNEMSMVLDFGVVKKQIKAIIDEAVDHKLLLPLLDKSIQVSDSTYNDDHEFVDITSNIGSYHLQSPKCAFAKIDNEVIDVASVTKHLTAIIKQSLPNNVDGLTLVLRPEDIKTDYYHYTHGLKLHDGNCQRIAHGHRSTITIIENGVRSHALEKQWCQRWKDIYIASDSDQISIERSQLSTLANKVMTSDHQIFSYLAPQGRFDIAVRSNILEIVDCDSTVELLADWIARQLKQQAPDNHYKVIAFEGVGKGAIASV